ncbi:peptidoglycan editing factor PgeF [Granulicella arctica]|uniref:Purine nucleoside phosphorylase n=1 Tax=Granulicella arctica TaxID=940613 RepID=A0A7Y9PGL6_9BACT|nr:peptidoglycan editing factor PgeF [Granulicella arctica]NYF79535.1 hypothetical protein [Granulicella arctica]
MDCVRIPGWERFSWLRHGFSTRVGGVSTIYGGHSLNLGWTKEDDPVLVAENRLRLLDEISGLPGQRAIALRQIHSAETHIIRSKDGPFETTEGRAILEGDGLMTSLPNTFLGIQTADCVPVMLLDSQRHTVAVFHAGWRGTAAGIVEQGIAIMRQEYHSLPEDLFAAVGPSIGSCCYTVGDELREAFTARFSYAPSLFHENRLDLWEANRRQLADSGIPSNQIAVVAECTGCARTSSGERKYFSHRIDLGITGRMMSVIGIAEP